jgi:hypothetical protein
MVGPFGGQRGTSLRPVELQVAGRIDDREMGCCEAVSGAAAGKSLARMQIIMGLAKSTTTWDTYRNDILDLHGPLASTTPAVVFATFLGPGRRLILAAA